MPLGNACVARTAVLYEWYGGRSGMALIIRSLVLFVNVCGRVVTGKSQGSSRPSLAVQFE